MSKPLTFYSNVQTLAPFASSCILRPVTIARVDWVQDRVLFSVNANDQWGRSLVADARGLLSRMRKLLRGNSVRTAFGNGVLSARGHIEHNYYNCSLLMDALKSSRSMCADAFAHDAAMGQWSQHLKLNRTN